MATSQSILVISDLKEEIAAFHSKLLPLRSVDNVISAGLANTIESAKKYMPDVIIIFDREERKEVIDVCVELKSSVDTANTPIMLIMDQYSEEFLVAAFDAGISDYIVKPLNETEILTRVIWCLQKNEILRQLEKKELVLSQLGVIEQDGGIYTPKFISKIFENEINLANKYKYPLALMALNFENSDMEFKNIIKNSTRSSDIICGFDKNKYYIILSKTNEKGVEVVFRRLRESLPPDVAIKAGACIELENISYERITNSAIRALDRASKDEGDRVVIIKAEEKRKSQATEKWNDKVSS